MTDRLVIETSVLIDHQRAVPAAESFVDDLHRNDALVIHPVSAAEILHAAIDQRDMAATVRFLASLRRLPVKSADYERCLHLIPQYRLSHGIGWADCLIAATCIRLNLPLVTLNDKHLRAIRSLRVVRPY